MARRRKPYEYEEAADPFISVGIDAEWVFESAGRNRILSYQFAVLNNDTGKSSKTIIYPRNGGRITIEHGLTRAFGKARRQGVIDRIPKRFIVCGHFIRADLTTFEDFCRFKRRIGAVRKSYASTELPLSLSLATEKGKVRCNALVVDTLMLAPAGTSLDAIGKLLGVPKIELPEGYSKDRMDLFLQDHPALFEKYALTDAIIPALWVAKTYGVLLDKLGIKKKVITLGGASVELVRAKAKKSGIELHDFLGRDKKKKQPLAHLATLIAIAAQSYHGGYNLAAALGFSPAGKDVYDLDIRSAYTIALAFIGVPDWAGARHCVEIKELAVIDVAMTAALVKFRFPDGTLFPCLPVRASKGRGLVYPMEDESWCTGPELVVAIESGARIEVMDGHRVDWRPGSTRLFEDITRRIGAIRAAAKALEPPDLVLDRLAKEIGNSVYGKLAQAVASTRIVKDDVELRRVFNTQFDVTDQMGPSAITNAPMASYCTGLVRALLLETLTRLPAGAWVGTATTDGLLSTCDLKDIDDSGPIATAFKNARERITPGDNKIWELKHRVPRVIVSKTRGTFSDVPKEWSDSVVLAKAGYRLPDGAELNEIEQCRIWIESYRERTYPTKMRMKSLTSLRSQHLFETDMQTVVRDVRWNSDYDMKRKLINVRDIDGLITADTMPWRSSYEFESARDTLEQWKKSQRRVLKTRKDYDDLTDWTAERNSRRRIGMCANNTLSPVAAAVLKALAHRMKGSEGILAGQLWHAVERPKRQGRAARLLSAICETKITETIVKNAKRRGAGPKELIGSITTLTDDDRRFLTRWLGFYVLAPTVLDIAEMLCAGRSEAAGELDDLFHDAFEDASNEQDAA